MLLYFSKFIRLLGTSLSSPFWWHYSSACIEYCWWIDTYSQEIYFMKGKRIWLQVTSCKVSRLYLDLFSHQFQFIKHVHYWIFMSRQSLIIFRAITVSCWASSYVQSIGISPATYTYLSKIKILQTTYNIQNGNVGVWIIEQMDIMLSHKCKF